MKKKRIELNQKLFLNKERIASLSDGQQYELVGGGGSTANFSAATSPCGICAQSQSPACYGLGGTVDRLCNFAGSVEPSACTPGCNVAAVSIGNIGTPGSCIGVISSPGGGC